MKNSKYGLTSFLFAAFSLSTLIITGFAASAKAQEASVVEASVNTQKTLHQIDRRVYSHFLEHIYNSCNGGLWGELVWNRSLEAGKAPSWSFDDGVLKQSSMANDCRFILGADLQKDGIAAFLKDREEHFDVLKVPHHGNKKEGMAELLAAVKPSVAVITDSAAKPADDSVLEMLRACGAAVFRTSVQGSIAIECGPDSMDVIRKDRNG